MITLNRWSEVQKQTNKAFDYIRRQGCIYYASMELSDYTANGEWSDRI